jgi:hypothetical protein
VIEILCICIYSIEPRQVSGGRIKKYSLTVKSKADPQHEKARSSLQDSSSKELFATVAVPKKSVFSALGKRRTMRAGSIRRFLVLGRSDVLPDL